MNKIKISVSIKDRIISLASIISIIISFILYKTKKINKNIFIITIFSNIILLIKKIYNIFDQSFAPISDNIEVEDDTDEIYDNIMKELDLEFEKEFA